MHIIAKHSPQKQSPKINDISASKMAPLGISAESPSNSQLLHNQIKYKMLRKAAELLPEERIATCCNHVVPNAKNVTVSYSAKNKTASYQNLVHCESYSCPNCSYIRSELDRHELSLAIAEAGKRGWHVSMLTCTLRHNKSQKLVDLHAALAKAFDATFSGGWYQRFVDEWLVVGKIKAWETTWGQSGWHPHLHILLFSVAEFGENSARSVQAQIAERWCKKLSKLGYNATLDVGVDFRTAQSEIADYIAKWGHEPLDKKWGAEHELTKQNSKFSKREGMSPFEILGAAAGIEVPLERFKTISGIDDTRKAIASAGRLYAEYFAAFKGEIRIKWGKMRRMLDMETVLYAYEQANPAAESDSIPVIKMSIKQWRKVIKHEWRAELKAIVAAGDVAAARLWCRERKIRIRYRRKWE